MVSTEPFPRILTPPESSFFLFGPRGAGKSTWLRMTYPDAHTIQLLNESLYQSYLADAGLFGRELEALPDGSRVVVDEIQRLPALLNEVHRFMEEKRLRFVLCGSSARKLKTAGTNLLAGRAVRRSLHGFVPEELGPRFDLNAALRHGTLPVILAAADRKDALLAYVEMYLKEEIQAEALVRNLPGFARFLPIAALFHGQVINTASLARDAGVARTTVAGYIEILEDTLLAFRLPAFEGRLRVRERKHPKLYWADPGLVAGITRRFDAPSPDETGHRLEGFVAGLLRAYRDYRGLFDAFYYWAPSEAARTEVDFLLERGGEFVAVEVKSAKRFSEPLCAGLRAVEGLSGLARRILVHLGDRPLRTRDGIDVLPIGRFIDAVAQDRIFP